MLTYVLHVPEQRQEKNERQRKTRSFPSLSAQASQLSYSVGQLPRNMRLKKKREKKKSKKEKTRRRKKERKKKTITKGNSKHKRRLFVPPPTPRCLTPNHCRKTSSTNPRRKRARHCFCLSVPLFGNNGSSPSANKPVHR